MLETPKSSVSQMPPMLLAEASHFLSLCDSGNQLLRVSRESGNILYRAHIGIIFPVSLVTTSKLRGDAWGTHDQGSRSL